MYRLLIVSNDNTEEIKTFDNLNNFNEAMEAAYQLMQLGLINSVEELHRA